MFLCYVALRLKGSSYIAIPLFLGFLLNTSCYSWMVPAIAGFISFTKGMSKSLAFILHSHWCFYHFLFNIWAFDYLLKYGMLFKKKKVLDGDLLQLMGELLVTCRLRSPWSHHRIHLEKLCIKRFYSIHEWGTWIQTSWSFLPSWRMSHNVCMRWD